MISTNAFRAGPNAPHSVDDETLKDDKPRSPSKLTIAFTCRHIYSEVALVFYSSKRFSALLISTMITIHGFILFMVAAIGEAIMRCIKNLGFLFRWWISDFGEDLAKTILGKWQERSPLRSCGAALKKIQALFLGRPTISLIFPNKSLMILLPDGTIQSVTPPSQPQHRGRDEFVLPDWVWEK